jgi:hypothetical protein
MRKIPTQNVPRGMDAQSILQAVRGLDMSITDWVTTGDDASLDHGAHCAERLLVLLCPYRARNAMVENKLTPSRISGNTHT